jgi:F-type H+-transporting ATPase subunit delta
VHVAAVRQISAAGDFMSSRASAARYARALLDVVIKDGNPEQVEQQLIAFTELVERTPQLRKALSSPAVPTTAKRGIIEQVIARMQLSPPLARLLLMLADGERLVLIANLAPTYSAALREHRQVVQAEVTTAMPMPAEQLAQFENRLAQATGRRVTMTSRVDPSLIGGAVARVGSVVYDGSVAKQLEKMRERLEKGR